MCPGTTISVLDWFNSIPAPGKPKKGEKEKGAWSSIDLCSLIVIMLFPFNINIAFGGIYYQKQSSFVHFHGGGNEDVTLCLMVAALNLLG